MCNLGILVIEYNKLVTKGKLDFVKRRGILEKWTLMGEIRSFPDKV